MLMARFYESEEIMEWTHGGLTKKRFHIIMENLLANVTSYGPQADYDEICYIGERYYVYCLVRFDGTGYFTVVEINKDGEERELFTKNITNAYWWMWEEK